VKRSRHRFTAVPPVVVPIVGAGLLTTALLTTVPAAATTSTPAAAGAQRAPAVHAQGRTPTVWPVPEQVQPRQGTVAITGKVGVVVGAHTDPSALDVVKQTLAAAGARRLVTASATEAPPKTPVTVYVGGPAENTATADVLNRLKVQGPAGLAREGYVLGVGATGGRGMIALSGVDATGTYYAAQTLRQLVVTADGGSTVPDIAIRDWPAMPLRGVIEGFYGPPWSQADRLSQLDFYGRTKQNTYVYSPKDDPYLRSQWRDTYPPDELAEIKTLVARATADHVAFTYALSPGLSICYSSAADTQRLIDKFQSLWDIGVRSFAIPLDDISYTHWNCDADGQTFGTGGGAAGKAQAYLLNHVQKDFIATHPGAERLQMVPTEYYDTTDSPYKTALRQDLDSNVIVEWTGVGVVAPQIRTDQAAAARQVLGHDILVWDNYPVNDYAQRQLFLGPYVGREPGIAGQLAGVTANPMIEAEASKIAEFTSGDFLWNPRQYDPDAAWLAAIKDLGGAQWKTLKIVAENNYSNPLRRLGQTTGDQDSPVLRKLIADFWAAYKNDGQAARPAVALARYFAAMAGAPAKLRSGLHNAALLDEIGPWLDKLGYYGQAGDHALRMLAAQHAGDAQAAWRERLALQTALTKAKSYPADTAKGVAEPFFNQALAESDRMLGGSVARRSPLTSMGTYSSYAPELMLDDDPATFYWSDRGANSGDYVGVDLGAVQSVTDVDIQMAKTSSPNDYIHSGVLEYSTDGTSWTQAVTVADQPAIKATLPAGTKARYVRLRATAGQEYWVVVDEFSVTLPDGLRLSVSGAPPAAAGSSAARAADGDPDTAYVAARPPQAEEALTVGLSAARRLDKLVILQAVEQPARATVEVRDGTGSWHSLGQLAPGYTELRGKGIEADQIRLSWTAGSPAPIVYDVIPTFAG
jgi:hyaluronoglucosaminidase